MMKVSNRKCIRKLSFKTLCASRTRNLIAVLAIALTALLFTSLFTVALSLNSSYQTYTFRTLGGYSHGSFKDVNEEQIAALSAHPKVKETAKRSVIGYCEDGIFAKAPAEVSYMDSNNMKWSYCVPTVGREAQRGKEITMDTKALELLGAAPELGTQVELTYKTGDQEQKGALRTDTFTLVGFWEYDNLSPVHFINISEEYAKQVTADLTAEGLKPLRTDLSVMLASSMNIRGVMEEIDTDLGYQWENQGEDNCVRIGVNWGYTASQLASGFDAGIVFGVIAFLALVAFTGYLIIYNIFQISVAGDIRFFGLLKTIGVTPRQLRRIIRQQALFLSLIGIPAGLLGGYAIGAVLTPYILEQTTLGSVSSTISASPVIFIGSAVFSLVTVIISCNRPGRMAAKVSPVEAAKYTEVTNTKKKRRTTRGAKIYQMAFANLGRNKRKTILVMLSLSLSVVLLTILSFFVGGFDMEKYIKKQTCADFIAGPTQYFRFQGDRKEAEMKASDIEEIRRNTKQTVSGSGYALTGYRPQCFISADIWKEQMSHYISEKEIAASLNRQIHRDGLIAATALIEGLDESLFEKLTVVEGDLAPLFDPDSNAIAICVNQDDYGNVDEGPYPAVGDLFPVAYVEEFQYLDSRTGEPCKEGTPEEYLQEDILRSRDVDYTVCALVIMPHSMSFRFSTADGFEAVLPMPRLRADSGREPQAMFYLFDTPDAAAEGEAESYLAGLTAGDFSELMYESKATVREEFKNFQNMFLLLGSMLCFIVGFVGILNFFNAIMTGILSRRHEFAVLESIGMTRRQLKNMLVFEGMFYALGSAALSLGLSIVLSPLVGNLMEQMFWFFTYRFTFVPSVLTMPVFLLLGWLIPLLLYRSTVKSSVVERLRETE